MYPLHLQKNCQAASHHACPCVKGTLVFSRLTTLLTIELFNSDSCPARHPQLRGPPHTWLILAWHLGCWHGILDACCKQCSSSVFGQRSIALCCLHRLAQRLPSIGSLVLARCLRCGAAQVRLKSDQVPLKSRFVYPLSQRTPTWARVLSVRRTALSWTVPRRHRVGPIVSPALGAVAEFLGSLLRIPQGAFTRSVRPGGGHSCKGLPEYLLAKTGVNTCVIT